MSFSESVDFSLCNDRLFPNVNKNITKSQRPVSYFLNMLKLSHSNCRAAAVIFDTPEHTGEEGEDTENSVTPKPDG